MKRTTDRHHRNSGQSFLRAGDGPFAGLSELEKRKLEGVMTSGVYARGQILFQAGNRPIGIHSIQKGLVKLYRVGSTGKEQIIRLAVAGDLLGYRPLLADKPHDIYAQAVTDVRVCCIPADSIRFLLRGTPPMMRNMAKIMAGEMASIEDRLVQRSQQKAEDRLISFLLRCAEGVRAPQAPSAGPHTTEGVRSHGNGHVEIPLSRQEIADFIGAAPETVIRALGRLQRDQLIRVSGRYLEIPNPGRLAAKLQSAMF